MVDHGGVLRRHELTDQEWELLAPLIPRAATGRPRVSDRQVINGMVYKIRTGISWRDLPERYGPGRRSTPASAATPSTGCSPGPCNRSKLARTRPATATGSSRSTPPSSAPTSTPPPPAEKGAPSAGRTG
ncbi:transposase, partial [Streptomyces pseudogriseolus]|uniref:transposase n=1 Tax=Streptomyces pseudogriseolus TaxID=36817 RepID=UPI003FA2FE5E